MEFCTPRNTKAEVEARGKHCAKLHSEFIPLIITCPQRNIDLALIRYIEACEPNETQRTVLWQLRMLTPEERREIMEDSFYYAWIGSALAHRGPGLAELRSILSQELKKN